MYKRSLYFLIDNFANAFKRHFYQFAYFIQRQLYQTTSFKIIIFISIYMQDTLEIFTQYSYEY